VGLHPRGSGICGHFATWLIGGFLLEKMPWRRRPKQSEAGAPTDVPQPQLIEEIMDFPMTTGRLGL
jgi:hypothetical protein